MHELGDKAFEQTFVTSGSALFGGLGPVFNNVSCISCHHNDGKGTPTAGLPNSSLLLRISLPRAGCPWCAIGCSGFWIATAGPGAVWRATGNKYTNYLYG